MATVQQLICDRCKQAITDTGPNRKSSRLTRYNTDYHGTRVDLCGECTAQFFAWLENPEWAPPGYEYRVRPCPHHVPCADPDGCSGKELGPIGAG